MLVTGLQADYRLNDYWNFIGGFHDGFNAFEDPNGMLHFLGGAKWHNDEQKTSVSLMTDIGPQAAADDTSSGCTAWSSRSNSAGNCSMPLSR